MLFNLRVTMLRATLIGVVALMLNACVAMISGRVDTASHQQGTLAGTFTVISPDELSLMDRALSEMIANRMLKQGFERATDLSTPDVAVLFSYAIGDASVWSQPDFVRGGHSVYSVRPRSFQLILVNLAESRQRGELSVLWQGETYSTGSSSDIRRVAPYFLDAIFDNFGETVSNKTWTRPFIGP
jgi:hypothetical protein